MKIIKIPAHFLLIVSLFFSTVCLSSSQLSISLSQDDITEYLAFVKGEDSDYYFPSHWDKGMVLASIGDSELFEEHYSFLSETDRISALLTSVSYDYIEIVKFLVRNDISVNSTDLNGNTPIYAAIYWGAEGAFDFLIKNGVNVNFVPDGRMSNINYAIISENFHFIPRLIDLKAKCDDRTLEIFNLVANSIDSQLPEYCEISIIEKIQ